MPEFVSDPSVSLAGELEVNETGELYYLPQSPATVIKPTPACISSGTTV